LTGHDLPDLDQNTRNVNNVFKPRGTEFLDKKEVTFERLKMKKIKQIIMNKRKNPIQEPPSATLPMKSFLI
jgi:hypothetical protein